jgi:hypothetical protein
MSDYLITEYVSTQPGEAYRLFPFGTVYKGGKCREITPEYAAKFHLPHFKPAIKLGSHKEETPAGGHIVGLEVRSDGLYAIPEYNDSGLTALDNGAYRYQSPEVIWEGGFEDPSTGKLIEGPLIIGDALLHMPHLGEAAALYSVVETGKEQQMSDNVEVPKGLLDRFNAWLDKLTTEPEPKPEKPAVLPEEMSAVIVERDQLKAQLDQLAAEKQQAEAVHQLTTLKAGIVTTLQKPEQFGAAWVELTKAEEAAAMLSAMAPEHRDWVMRQFGALAMQIRESNLTGELGSEGQGVTDPRLALDGAIKARMADRKIDYNTAQIQLAAEKPELFSIERKV